MRKAIQNRVRNMLTQIQEAQLSKDRRIEEAFFIKQPHLMEMPVNGFGGDYDVLFLREILTSFLPSFFQIYAEATLVFPLLVGETFAKRYHATKVKAESDV